VKRFASTCERTRPSAEDTAIHQASVHALDKLIASLEEFSDPADRIEHHDIDDG
jgi:hypothetical protein